MRIDNILVIIMGLLLSCLLIANPTAAVVVMGLIITVFFCIKLKIEHYLLLFILLYPILPYHAGIDLGKNFPVIRLHRVLILFMILCWVSKKEILVSLKSFVRFPLTKLLWIAIPIFALSYFSKLNFKGWVFFMGNFFFENFMIAFIFYDVLKDKTTKDIKRVFIFIAASILIPLLIGAIEYVSGFNIFSKIEPFREVLKENFPVQERLGVIRIKGGFIHSIIYGLFFAMIVPAGLFLFAVKEKKLLRYYLMLILFLLLCFIGTYMSLSRIAFLVLCINAFTLLLFSNGLNAIIFSISFFLIFVRPFLMNEIKGKVALLVGGIFGYGYAVSEMADSSYGRLEQINIHMRTILSSPFLGTGGLSNNGPCNIDNNYLSFMLNSGISGLLAYLAFFIVPMVLSFRMLRHSKDVFYRNICFYTFVLLVNTFLVFSVLSLTDYLYIVWIYIGIFMASRVIKCPTNPGILCKETVYERY